MREKIFPNVYFCALLTQYFISVYWMTKRRTGILSTLNRTLHSAVPCIAMFGADDFLSQFFRREEQIADKWKICRFVLIYFGFTENSQIFYKN